MNAHEYRLDKSRVSGTNKLTKRSLMHTHSYPTCAPAYTRHDVVYMSNIIMNETLHAQTSCCDLIRSHVRRACVLILGVDTFWRLPYRLPLINQLIWIRGRRGKEDDSPDVCAISMCTCCCWQCLRHSVCVCSLQLTFQQNLSPGYSVIVIAWILSRTGAIFRKYALANIS